MRYGLPPIVDRSTTTLILSPFSDEPSVAAHEYYAGPRDRFWSVMGGVLGEDLCTRPYQERIAALAGRNIGLWETYSAVKPAAHAAAAIRGAIRNPVLTFVQDYGNIARVVENGKAAALDNLTYDRLTRTGVKIVTAPSTSQVNTRWALERLVHRWRTLLGLDPQDA